ncbi:MAG: type III-B CRISPR module-associated protein Cmr5, partial [Synergistaceae bacterium]|nr:type III-B CRISPR module-associated protein Cmr5 [Synergistaceae bacterium]
MDEIENGRAKFALEAVKGVRNSREIEEKTKKEYKAYCKKFAGLIMTNGLAAALAFAVEKKGAYLLIYRQIEE